MHRDTTGVSLSKSSLLAGCNSVYRDESRSGYAQPRGQRGKRVCASGADADFNQKKEHYDHHR